MLRLGCFKIEQIVSYIGFPKAASCPAESLLGGDQRHRVFLFSLHRRLRRCRRQPSDLTDSKQIWVCSASKISSVMLLTMMRMIVFTLSRQRTLKGGSSISSSSWLRAMHADADADVDVCTASLCCAFRRQSTQLIFLTDFPECLKREKSFISSGSKISQMLER